jgi:hypothetical protein
MDSSSEGVIPTEAQFSRRSDLAWSIQDFCARDPFDFAQGRLFPSPEKRLREG